jgi:hypothetical protein
LLMSSSKLTSLNPLITLTFVRRGGGEKRGAGAPLRRPTCLISSGLALVEVLERGEVSLQLGFPPSLTKGRGDGLPMSSY